MPKAKKSSQKTKQNSSKKTSCFSNNKTCPLLMGLGSLFLAAGSALFFWKKSHPKSSPDTKTKNKKASKKIPSKNSHKRKKK